MLMTPITPKVMARPIAASSSTEPSEMPYQAFCAVDQMASVLCTEAIAACAVCATSGEGSLATLFKQRQRVLVAAVADDGDRFDAACLRRIGLAEQDGRLGFGEGALDGGVGFLRQRALDDRQRIGVARLEHGLRRLQPPCGIGREQRQSADGGFDRTPQAVVEADGAEIGERRCDGFAGRCIGDLAVAFLDVDLLGGRIGDQAAVLQRLDDGQRARVAACGDGADRGFGVGE